MEIVGPSKLYIELQVFFFFIYLIIYFALSKEIRLNETKNTTEGLKLFPEQEALLCST